ncbi:hypothetical protein L1049_023544 [Liquidambar formosana]|uniref:Uncharacterized protein n=1 Tax=Liquidambar formosana TaxID=63359 RepID=A0AAP0RT13_LIQFO
MLKALVIDFFCTAAFDITIILKIPTYYFIPGCASGVAIFLYLPTIDQNTTKSIKDLNTNLYIPGLPPIPSSDMPLAFLDRTSTAYASYKNTAIQMTKSKGIIVNTVEFLEARAVKAITDGLCTPNAPAPPIFCIGPLVETYHQTGTSHGGDEHDCLIWLNSQPVQSVLFLSFGSRGLLSAKQLKEMAIGLERSGHRFLWVVRSPPPEDNSKRYEAPPEPDLDILLPQGFLNRTKDRGLVVKSWAPQVEVLNHKSVGGFVTNCGWVSFLEAVCAGVPTVGWPLYAEQKMNRVFMVEEMKAVLRLDQLEDGFVSADELEKRVRELMDSERGKEVRERVMAMRDGVMAAVEEGGSTRVALAKLADSWQRG